MASGRHQPTGLMTANRLTPTARQALVSTQLSELKIHSPRGESSPSEERGNAENQHSFWAVCSMSSPLRKLASSYATLPRESKSCVDTNGPNHQRLMTCQVGAGFKIEPHQRPCIILQLLESTCQTTRRSMARTFAEYFRV